VSVLAVHSVVAVSLDAGMLMADVCMVAKAGQGRAWQGRAGQGRAGQGRTHNDSMARHITKGAVSIGWSGKGSAKQIAAACHV